MKKIILSIFVLLCCTSVQAAFIEGLEDVPIMDGMTQITNDNISFGNEESRLIEAVLIGKSATFKSIKAFYKNTLPQMGWIFQNSTESTLVFEREEEIIEIQKEDTNPLKIRITVKSRN